MPQQKYAQIEKEALGITWACERFSFTISHVPGKDLTIADTLSRAPTVTGSDTDFSFCQDTDMFVNIVMSCLPTTER